MEKYICQYCHKECKNANSLRQHEVRCKQNPNHIECYGNRGNMPEHTKAYYKSLISSRDGVKLDITRYELDEYSKKHQTCEICGRTIDNCVKWKSKYRPRHFCVDHDHNTNKFRGLLCSVCNRQLGWYEKYKNEIDNYLNKDSVM